MMEEKLLLSSVYSDRDIFLNPINYIKNCWNDDLLFFSWVSQTQILQFLLILKLLQFN